ncbi:MAG: head-tail adaptor protein [Acidaminococcaceae bacterium]
MQAGRMKYKLTLLEPARTTDRMGAEDTTYNPVKTVYAERAKVTGNRSEEVGEHFADYHTEFNIRNSHTIAENWRVKQLGGYLYTVLAIVPNLDRGYNTLICDRVNE